MRKNNFVRIPGVLNRSVVNSRNTRVQVHAFRIRGFLETDSSATMSVPVSLTTLNPGQN